MAKKTYSLVVTPLTGVHIGTGEKLNPLDYKLVKSSSGAANAKVVKDMYWKFSSDHILRRLIAGGANLTDFERASVDGNMGELRHFFHENCTVEDIDYLCDITEEFKRQYSRNLQNDPGENAAEVHQMYHPGGSKKPVIPGSSIKGSIRTGILNFRLASLEDNEYNALPHEKKDAALQKKLLRYSDEKSDPFRCISLEDCAFQAKDTQLVGVLKNIRYNRHHQTLDGLEKLQIQAEVIRGKFLGGVYSAETAISIDADLQDVQFPESAQRRGSPANITPISMQDLMEACNYFYLREFKKEYEHFYSESIEGTDLIVKLKQDLEEAVQGKNQFIIRVGRWSQVEFVTFEEEFRIPYNTKGSGGTRTVFDYNGQYVPMGWCSITAKENV
ncbi:hypothetical protein TREPR_1097 [Treponema primitia ZAS-2]|uniref:CRISPR system Cms protein Csm5 n=1 Tax=Treponema primitia (strain ATCC BAA-887 / DSM 12427 / ZAS-2) TaxID=545694 RepID=F5YHA7_TREPZ|nr:RAMP superfamily CRISPR-associated protein [Treponema primitia]AEF84818.1 hypothetical protein TREPR_1097 [Treponema primitia ZAS-2]